MYKYMRDVNKAFETYMRVTHGNHYNLVRDCEGFYANETVKRMFEVYQLYHSKRG